MHFNLVDSILEIADDRIVTVKNVTAAEEYLQDHFPTFPVLPGVLMIEAMVQAARALAEHRRPDDRQRYVLGSVRALKYGSFVKPGDAMRIEVTMNGEPSAGVLDFRGTGEIVRPDHPDGQPRPVCVSGRFTLRPVRPGGSAGQVSAEIGHVPTVR